MSENHASADKKPESKEPEGKSGQKRDIRISVRNLVEFVMRSGDIDNRRTSGADKDAMQEGSRLHRKLQRRMGGNYQAEVSLKHVVEQDGYRIVVEGRADGILTEPAGVTVDEIKGVYMELARLDRPVPVHQAQAMCYGYIYAYEHQLAHMGIQVTYCSLETEEIRRFRVDRDWEELELWFQGLIHEYVKWAEYRYRHELRRDLSIAELEFPYPYRPGQKELAVSVYRAESREKNLFIQAPTGIGKTLSVIFPSLKVIGEGKGEKLFYLTARTITRSVAEDAFRVLREQGLFFHTVTITAKEKLCFLEKAECNPEACPYAKGHFDRVNDAVFDIIHNQSGIDRELVLEYAGRYQVCPFEFCLDISNWVDGIICDYNYVFDPNARLKRYFADGVAGHYLFLIDEAHNLVSRARQMYSAMLCKEDVLEMKRIIKERSPKLKRYLERCNKLLLEMKRECESYRVLEDCAPLAAALMTTFGEMETFLEEHREFADREQVLQCYFDFRHFLAMYDNLGDDYRIYTEMGEDGHFYLRLFCINPARSLKKCMEKGAAVFFSATLLPIRYYKELLGGSQEDYAVYAESPFDREQSMLLIASDVSSRYSRRSRNEYCKVAEYIGALAKSRTGNYLVFFPSYRFMKDTVEALMEQWDGSFEYRLQESHMTEAEREDFLREFDRVRERSFVGFCVMGGMFSEGIDLTEEKLIGTAVVGMGLPMVCTEQEILRQYFDNHGMDGFDYAYQYPGMNKVMQAAGRVIRTAKDRGVILLLDDRFLRPETQELFPREWQEYGIVTRRDVAGWLEHFWETKAFP